MTTFTFTTADGETYEVDAANGTSESEARQVFDQQFNAGALDNIGVGESLKGMSEKAKTSLGSLGSLTNVPVSVPVSAADVLKMVPATKDIGTLNTQQVTGLLGQATDSVKQAANGISLDKGVGQFGLSPQQLEQQGFLKTGTVSQFIGNNPAADWTKVLANPAVWAGKEGVTGLSGFLGSSNLQNITQQNIMSQGLTQLKNLGVTSGIETPQQLGALVQGAAKFGADTMAKWTQGSAPAGLVGQISNLAKNAQFGIDLVDSKLPKVPRIDPAGIVDSVKRTKLDNSIKATLDDPKIPPIEYGPVEKEPIEPDTARPFLDKWNEATKAWLDKLNSLKAKGDDLTAELVEAEAGTITQGVWDSLNTKLQNIRQEFNVELRAITDNVQALKSQAPANISAQILETYNSLARLQNILQKFLAYLRDRIRDDEAFIGT